MKARDNSHCWASRYTRTEKPDVVIKNVHLAIDYQFVANPRYNADRVPVNVFSSRFHFQFLKKYF